MPESTQWLKRQQAADLLGISPRQVDAYARQGLLARYYLPPLPSERAHRQRRPSPRFRIEDVNALLRETP